MESKFAIGVNGQSVQIDDLNLIASEAALADDRVLWELLRFLPQSSTPQKAIMPYGVQGWASPSGLNSTALVSGGTADATVRVMPFRAAIGSTDTSSQTEMMRGIRSGYHVGTSTAYTSLVLNPNGTLNPRWTLVYAAITPAANSSPVVRYAKDATTKVVGPVNVVTTTACTVTVATADGTPGATPTKPSLPADAGGTYYAALAYVWVPASFGATSVVARATIHDCAPVVRLHSATGASSLAPANQAHAIGGTVETNQLNTSAGSTRPSCYLPATMVGGESRLIPLQFGISPASHATGDLVDNSLDWRGRVFRWNAMAIDGSAAANGFVWDKNSSGGQQVPRADLSLAMNSTASGMGESMYATHVTPTGYTFAAVSNYNGTAALITDAMLPQLGAFGSAILLYVDTSGALRLAKSTSGAVSAQVFVWLDASTKMGNFGAY